MNISKNFYIEKLPGLKKQYNNNIYKSSKMKPVHVIFLLNMTQKNYW